MPTLLRPPTTTSVPESTTTTDDGESSSTTERRTVTTRSSGSGAERTTTVDVNEASGTNLLVRGDGTAGGGHTTTTLRTARIGSGGPSDGTLIALVIAGLLLIALAVSVLTWRYWVATRPVPLDGDHPPTDG